jgi:hypothetical protein
MELEALCKK